MQSIQAFEISLFADDTNIFCSGDDLAKLLLDLTEEMIKLKNGLTATNCH